MSHIHMEKASFYVNCGLLDVKGQKGATFLMLAFVMIIIQSRFIHCLVIMKKLKVMIYTINSYFRYSLINRNETSFGNDYLMLYLAKL